MIQISVSNKRIEINGHANVAPHGQSVPCEAVTVLVNTYIASLEHYQHIEYELASGHFAIDLKQIDYVGDILTTSFKLGLEMVSEAYPEYISYSKV